MWLYGSLTFNTDNNIVEHYSGASVGPPEGEILNKSWIAAMDKLGEHSWELVTAWPDRQWPRVTMVFKHSRPGN